MFNASIGIFESSKIIINPFFCCCYLHTFHGCEFMYASIAANPADIVAIFGLNVCKAGSIDK